MKMAAEMGVALNASLADLQHMQENRLHKFKDIHLDDAKSGADMTRLGLTSLLSDAISDQTISHIFIYLPDRLARPEEPLEAALMQNRLSNAGITIVFSDRILPPRQRGENHFVQDMKSLYDYTEAGDYLNRLAQRVIAGQIQCAQAGGWTGGRAPYGFVRVLVDADGKEIQELSDRMRIRKPGCRTKIKPKDAVKIRNWLQILEWYRNEKIGVTKIAQRLNALQIPSPDAGRIRTDHGVAHAVTGKWSPATVLALIRNRAIIGMQSYGVQSEGQFRRLGKGGPRLLTNSDIAQDKPKVIQNPREVVMCYPSGFPACADKDLFEDCGKLLADRGKNQRGISRRRDPARYPLAMKVFDLTDGCGHPMYALTSGNRALYKCGRYLKTAGAECEHNTIDAEAVLTFVVDQLGQQVDLLGGRDALRRRLAKLVEAKRRAGPDAEHEQAVTQLQQLLFKAEAEFKIVASNLARADGQAEYESIRAVWQDQQAKVQCLQRQLDALKMKSLSRDGSEPAAQIEQALSIYDNLQTVLKNPIARSKISELFEKINVRLWLSFTTNLKGTRQVQVLTGGIMTTGACEPPVQPYGANNSHDGRPSAALHGPNSSLEAVGVKETPSVDTRSQKEDVSLTMVNRGDKIRTCDL
jgi:hypothetical protein